MDRKEIEKNTFSYYDNNAKEFAAFRGEGVSRYWSKELAHFQEFLQKGTILEVGCGVGNEAFILKEMGYQYVGIDNSLGMLGIAKKRVPEGNFACQDLRSLGLSFEFDGLIAIASLLHLEKEELFPTLEKLRKQLRKGGIGLLTLKEGVGTDIDKKGRFYSYYTPEELSRLILDSGLNLLDITIHEEESRPFICCFVQNP